MEDYLKAALILSKGNRIVKRKEYKRIYVALHYIWQLRFQGFPLGNVLFTIFQRIFLTAHFFKSQRVDVLLKIHIITFMIQKQGIAKEKRLQYHFHLLFFAF